MTPTRHQTALTLAVIAVCLLAPAAQAQDKGPTKWVQSKAYVIPKETATEGMT